MSVYLLFQCCHREVSSYDVALCILPETSFDVVCGCVCVCLFYKLEATHVRFSFFAFVRSRNVSCYFVCSFSLQKYNLVMCFLHIGCQRCHSTTCFPHNAISKLGDLSVRTLLIRTSAHLGLIKQIKKCTYGIKTK